MTPPNALAVFQHMDWSAVPVEQIAEGITRQMFYGDRVMVCRLVLAPLTVTPIHTHVHEQITLVERGRADFFVEGQKHTASAGDLLLFPSGILHGATMLEDEVVLIDIFSPPREDFIASRQR
ncbi:MAG TPA: cupin domain-containing protein [Vicinamibacterales bacterium]|jgi:quercetin dioxygenase-like cupin family protein